MKNTTSPIAKKALQNIQNTTHIIAAHNIRDHPRLHSHFGHYVRTGNDMTKYHVLRMIFEIASSVAMKPVLRRD